ncbi:hypothetical protein M422DRAFT_264516 [Sphaerobolus stellatus SS14]|uniref:Reverse transcriptase/retrotransposon-derived protein RNase H-like domain-containing protein n=1 Tax=Sphaerobolus stellatus (strain SS14) TaxID=990650 RepID=A0A0C9TTG0_SPHS4|nr:hypothetical protein M422DRAFT_264516 [Sphaerobolus stellatus SS14]
MSEDKIKVIQDWPVPQKITIPLTHLTKKGSLWDFTLACLQAFEALKLAFTSAPILHYIPEAQLVVETDASNYALAAILSLWINSELHPIAFHSRTFTSTELNYDVHDKELLAIFKAFKRWCHYLEGPMHTVDVITDHKNIEQDGPNISRSSILSFTSVLDVSLALSLRATTLMHPVLRGAIIMDLERLHESICTSLKDDEVASHHLEDTSDPGEPLDPRPPPWYTVPKRSVSFLKGVLLDRDFVLKQQQHSDVETSTNGFLAYEEPRLHPIT